MEGTSQAVDDSASSQFPLPRVTIKFCTQCKWLLRAAYFAQELLSTFSTSLGEVALQPSTGGVFVVEITHQSLVAAGQAGSASGAAVAPQRKILWDRKADGGFPETAELKRRVRNVIDPERDLGHVDRHHAAAAPRFHDPQDLPPSGTTPEVPATMTTGSDPAPTTAASDATDGGSNPLVRPRDLVSGVAPLERAVPAGHGGIKPQIRQPPARLQEAAEARLAAAREKQAAEKSTEAEAKDGEKAECKDCE